MTALHMAVANNNLEIIQLLLEKKANLEIKTVFGERTAFDIAILHNKIHILKIFLPLMPETELNKVHERENVSSSIKELIQGELSTRRRSQHRYL